MYYRRYTFWGALLLMGIVLIAACNTTDAKQRPGGDLPADVSESESVTMVKTEVVRLTDFHHFVHSNGKVKSLNEQVVVAEADGRLIVCSAKPGAFFNTGELIAQLETLPAELKITRAELLQYSAEKEYQSQVLGYDNLLPGLDSTQVAAIYRKLRVSSGLSGAEQDIKEARYYLSKSYFKAPFACVVADVSVQYNERVKAGQELFRVYNPADLVLEIKILESDIPLLKKGMPASVTPVANLQTNYHAFIYDINPYIDENGMAQVRLKIEKGAGLFPGMNCTAQITVPLLRALLVPKDAVVMRGGRAVIFTAKQQRAIWHYVTTGRDNGKEIEVLEGLNAGDTVITGNNMQLLNDAAITIN